MKSTNFCVISSHLVVLITTAIDVLKARKDELKKVSDEDKSKYIDHLVRLKDGKGVDAYICEVNNLLIKLFKIDY